MATVKGKKADEGLTLEKSAFLTLYGGQFTFSTQLLTLKYLFLTKSVLNEKSFKESDLPKFETTEAKNLG